MALGLRILPLLLTLVNQDSNNEDKVKDLPSISGFFNSAPTSSGQKEQDLLNKAGFTDTFSRTTAFLGGASAAAVAQVVYELNKEMSSEAYKIAKNAYRSSNQALKQATTNFNLAAKINPTDEYLESLNGNKTAAKAAAGEAAEAAATAAKEAAEAAATAADAAAKEAADAAKALKQANKARTFFTSSGNALADAKKVQSVAFEELGKSPKGKLLDAAKKIKARVSNLNQQDNRWYKQIGHYASKFKYNPKAYIIPGAALAALTVEMMFGDDRSDNKLNCKFNPGDKTLDFTVSGQNVDLFQASNFRFKVDNGTLMLSQNTEPITETTPEVAISGSRLANQTPVDDKISPHTLLTLAEIASEEQKPAIKEFLSANFPDSSTVPEELKVLYHTLVTPSAPAVATASAAPGAAANDLNSVLNKILKLGETPEEKLLKYIRHDLAFFSEDIAKLDPKEKKNDILERAQNHARANRITFDENDLISTIDGLFKN